MARVQRAIRNGFAVAATIVALACGGDGDNGPVGNTGSIQVVANPATLSVPQGGSGSLGATLTRVGGFTGVVTVVVTGLPTGITATVTPAQLSGTLTSATIDVIVAAPVATQTYTATITATAQGVAQATATYQLTVIAAPNYALAVTPATVSIPAGTSGGATVNIDRTNFTGAVALALVNPPAGITGSFAPAASTTSLATLVVNVPANVTPGNYPITIQGTATGPGVKTASLTVTVTAPPTGGTNVEYQYCDAADAPAFFAYQDGNGAWQAVTGTASGSGAKYTFTIRQGRGGVMTVFRTSSATVADALAVGRSANVRRQPARPVRTRDAMRARSGIAAGRPARRSILADVYETGILYASAAELAQDGVEDCQVSQSTKTVTVNVTGLTNGQFGIISIGTATELIIGGATPILLGLRDVPDRQVDFVASRMRPGTPPDKVFLFRNLNVPDGGSLPAIDFNATGAIVPATAVADLTGGGGDQLEMFTELVTVNGPSLLWFDLAPSTSAARPWAGIPSGSMVSGDFHAVVAFATPLESTTDFRVALKYVGPVTNQTLAFGSAIAVPATSLVAPGPYPRLRFQSSVPQEYNKGVTIDVLSPRGTGNTFTILATGAYLFASGDLSAYDFTMPDVAGLAGFPVAARLTAGPNDLSVSAFGFTGPGIIELEPTLGTEFRGATKGGTVNVP